jgi:hypothetical protein
MDPKDISIHIERVDNGWVVRGWSMKYPRQDGYMPEGTHVCRTPDQLSALIHEWASKQSDGPRSEL